MLRFLKNVSLVLILMVFAASGTVYAAPRVKVDNPVYHAGEIPQGKEISHEFTIENIGDESLTMTVKPC
ncbi:MAG TPA: hypothetical protein PLU81_10665 [Deltaproteobacteria bacterium]|nr:hypothetical protein [Deltaproteobacteria bacterium]HPJ93266.1 hypothetical protein [Deltaproteobacteria bacterium]HPR52240.1 hypothetical protein [Deltaproteobacteria bacterium]